jgi:NRAMP (natural resistance-associated macrophage protein)-like metal ion transporter
LIAPRSSPPSPTSTLGNFATNITAGARFGYTLLWVIVIAAAMAMLVQYLSAKLGVATGRDLPKLCREHLPHPVSIGLWVQAELLAMATDLAEFTCTTPATFTPPEGSGQADAWLHVTGVAVSGR